MRPDPPAAAPRVSDRKTRMWTARYRVGSKNNQLFETKSQQHDGDPESILFFCYRQYRRAYWISHIYVSDQIRPIKVEGMRISLLGRSPRVALLLGGPPPGRSRSSIAINSRSKSNRGGGLVVHLLLFVLPSVIVSTTVANKKTRATKFAMGDGPASQP